jgi:inner membrane protein
VDSVTQIALGAAVGEATLGRKIGKPALVWGGICGLLPDLDVLVPLGDVVKNFTYHRSVSHSLLVLTLLTPLMVALILKRHPQWKRYRPRWYLLVFLAFVTHILLDGLTVYGTQILWPLDTPPVMWSTVFIIDPAFSLPLIFGISAAFFMSRTKDTGHYVNLVCLLLGCIYLVWTIGMKTHVGNVAKASLDRNNINYNRIVTVPSPFNTFLWRILVMGDTTYYEAYYSIFDNTPSVNFTGHPNNKALLKPIEDHWAVKRLQWFTQTFYSVRQIADRIVITDLRMGTENAYIFRFQVGEVRNGSVIPFKSHRLKPDIDFNLLIQLWHRIWAEPAQKG